MKIWISLALIPALAGCADIGGTVHSAGTTAAVVADATGAPPPAALADRTRLDEQVAIGAEAMYRGARLLVEPLVDAGVIRGRTAERFRTLNREAFDAVHAVRTAYDAGNARSYAAATEHASHAIAQLIALAK